MHPGNSWVCVSGCCVCGDGLVTCAECIHASHCRDWLHHHSWPFSSNTDLKIDAEDEGLVFSSVLLVVYVIYL